MLRPLIDQDFNHHVVRGLTARIPGLDAVTARQAGLSSAPDPDLLAWAASEGRVLVTHDKKTMPIMRPSASRAETASPEY